MVQSGDAPLDWKPLKTVGPGVIEIRVHRGGEFRVVYVARFREAIYVLHCFGKKTRATRLVDVEIARRRLSDVVALRRREGFET